MLRPGLPDAASTPQLPPPGRDGRPRHDRDGERGGGEDEQEQRHRLHVERLHDGDGDALGRPRLGEVELGHGNLSKPLLPRAQMRGSSSRVWGCRTPSVTIIVVSLARTRDSLGNWSMSPLAAKGPSGRPAIILS